MKDSVDIGEPDVVVVGGGNAGLCAAITAAEHHENVLLVERAPFVARGGNSKYTRDIRCAHDKDRYTTGPYDENEFLNDILKVTQGKTDLELAKLVVKESWNVPEWMEKHGIRWQRPLGRTLHLGRTNKFFLGGGKALVNAYYNEAKKLRVKILYTAVAEDLHIERGKSPIVAINVDGRNVLARCKSVILTSGGFEANINWLKEFWGEAADSFIIRGTTYNDGLILRKLINKQAKIIGDPKDAHMIAVDTRAPKYDGGIVTRVDSIPFGIAVNKFGKRFYDEGEEEWPKRYAIWGKLIAEQPSQTAYSIFDSKVKNNFIPSAYKPYVANTLEELAKILRLDAEVLVNTVREFNDSLAGDGIFNPTILDNCRTVGLDPPKSHWALPINNPPFYAYPLRPGITFTYMGVAVDKRASVLDRTGNALPNVHAAGEIMTGNILTRGYLAGLGLLIGTVFGIIAGEEAAKNG